MPETSSDSNVKQQNQEAMDTSPLGSVSGQTAEAAASALRVDDSHTRAFYANFCRVTGTPEELILDFALNAHPFGGAADPLSVDQRLVMNYYTAKRLLQALHLSVLRHEAAFGQLETDVQKRVQGRLG